MANPTGSVLRSWFDEHPSICYFCRLTMRFVNEKCNHCGADYAGLYVCERWGTDADRCILPVDHRGPCKDTHGNTTTSLAAEILS